MTATGDAAATATATAKAEQHHPLHEIATSPSRRLLLKQWLKEEELLLRRIAIRESRGDAVHRELAFLSCAFLAFHSIILLLLFSLPSPSPSACRRSWIPCLSSLVCSAAFAWAFRYKSDTATAIRRILGREREDAALLARCVAELTKKGAEFDLAKEVDALRRAKCLRLEAMPAAGRRWSSTGDLGAAAMLAAAAAVVVLTRHVLCN